jgi:hypothetical protein
MYSAKQQKLEEFERKKRGRERCYDPAIADFRTPETNNELVISGRDGFSMTRFIACLNKRLNKNVIDKININIVNGTRKLLDLKDLVCTPSLTGTDLVEHEIGFCSYLKDHYNDEISKNWMNFINFLYSNITKCTKDSPYLQTRSIDSVDELIGMYKEWSPTRSPTSKKKGGKSKRVKRSKTCKNRVHKRRN